MANWNFGTKAIGPSWQVEKSSRLDYHCSSALGGRGPGLSLGGRKRPGGHYSGICSCHKQDFMSAGCLRLRAASPACGHLDKQSSVNTGLTQTYRVWVAAQGFRDRRRSGKIISSVLWIKKGYLEEARWLNNSLTCWRRYVILRLSENVISAGLCLIGYRCLSWRGHRVCFFVDGISVLGGCAISDGSDASRISGQRLKYKQIIWLTYFSSGLMGLVLYLVFCSYRCPAEEDIIGNLTLFRLVL